MSSALPSATPEGPRPVPSPGRAPAEPAHTPQSRREGLQEFLRVFDRIRIRPTRRGGDIPLPILWVTGPWEATSALADAFEERCAGTPHTVVAPAQDPPDERSAPPYAALAAQLWDATRHLAEHAAPGEAHLRFPLFAQVQWLLGLHVTEEGHELRDGVRRAMNQRRRQIKTGTEQERRSFWKNVRAYAEGPLPAWAAATAILSAGWADQLTTLFGLCALLAGPVIGSLHVLLLSRTWAGRRRYMWFLRQPYLMPENRRNQPRDLTGFAVRLLSARDDAAAAEPRRSREAAQANDEIERLLVNAFLEDLRQGFERRLWKVWRRVAWARTSYPVMLVNGGDPRLVSRIEEVRGAARLADPLLVVVTGPGERPGPASRPGVLAGRPDTAEELWDRWGAELARDRALGSVRDLRIELEAEDEQAVAKANSLPVYRRPRPLLAHPLIPWIAVTALVAVSLVRVLATATATCGPGIWRTSTGECVGVSEGGFEFAPHLAPVLGLIDRQNRAILTSGHPYATVVYFGKLTTSGTSQAGAYDPLTDIHGELAGIALAQGRLIENNTDGSLLQMRVVLANAGADFRYAQDVARETVRRAEEDPTIIGVIGLGESRTHVRAAIEELGRKALPVISTTATFDDLDVRVRDGRRVPSFFPLAPPNSRLAAVAAGWARAGVPERKVRGARTAKVFIDSTSTDLIGTDLGAKFTAAFGREAEPVPYRHARDFPALVTKACGQKTQPDLMYYAGRTAQFGAFVTAIEQSQCQGLTIMANDDVTQYVNDHAPELGGNQRVRVMYVALAPPSATRDQQRVFPAKFKTDFYRRLDALTASLGMTRLPRTHLPSPEYAVQAQDAAVALMAAAQEAFAGQGVTAAPDGPPPVVDRGGVLLALENLQEIDGDSGLVKLHGAADRRHAKDRPILLVALDPDGRQVVIRQCGKLYAKQPATADCREP
ncbi:hypothetical protein Ssi03_18260 [Sphaerisporangium siamense]|uniref:Uncharacterized protein n=1 Tax=Sphaerisporangium siamense TaxID=795645 RepID=A0A7W7DDU1_9ACTN|nr:hypothetical protein [Sphaerisporangium siamense]MBB4705030.1 hypothetical protein [Sphaerisporangium siamense]GII83836.1 hypothetical protein Ssi03_18260 [Sphaerisporangium siamense]